MYKNNNQYNYSPSDLTCYLDSPFASWYERYALECPDSVPPKDAKDELLKTLSQKGYTHEDNFENKLKEEGKQVVKIEGKSNAAKEQNTLQAMQQGAEIIVQARLSLQYNDKITFAGYADFLVKVEHTQGQADSKFGNYHYEVWDTKLSRSVKPYFLVQLCCYAEMLEHIQGIRPKHIEVILGNDKRERFKADDHYYFYQSLKNDFITAQEHFDVNNPPNPADYHSFGSWSEYAQKLLIEQDHLSQIATITKGQIKKLNKAGITTVEDFINHTDLSVKDLHSDVVKRLQMQAILQRKSENKDRPKFEVLAHETGVKQGLALLPPHSALDVFFDIEGNSLEQGGLEYLWGNTYFDENGKKQFKDFWAHNREQEKQAFQDFIQWVYARWKKDPTMHIYHYANYEIAACKKLMGRFGVCENEVDELLRNEVFVDLYKVVKGGIMLGTNNYSIKSVELLYRGKRDTAVANGGASIVVYEDWKDAYQKGEQGDTWQTSSILNDIREYNIDDCNSTQELVEWLREQQAQHNVAYLGKTEVVKTELPEEITEVIALRDKLLQKAEQERKDEQLEKAKLTENLAWVLEFHRREDKPKYWRLFDRLGLSTEELYDDLDCLAYCQRTEKEPFKPTPRARNLAYEYRFNPNQEFKGGAKTFYLLGIDDENGKKISVTFVSESSDLDNGIIVLQSKSELPNIISLVPNDIVNAQPIPQAIASVVKQYAEGYFDNKPSAIIDFMTRSKPRLKEQINGSLVSSSDANERLQEIIHIVQQLDRSYLTIQGPPGAGKSYTGKHIIAELVKSGKKVGISSNSHKAINNLLLSTAQHCKEHNINAYFACTNETDKEALEDYDVAILKNKDLHGHTDEPCVLGTTAWGFSRDDMENTLDYLFIDEAGQVSVANLIAMSRCAKNLILMGDQMQLGQPSQGTHPGESGLSILDYLLHETPTIADDMGIFLGTTYRMHSAVNKFISQHIYDNKLKSNTDSDKRIIEVPSDYQGILNQQAGIIYVPVSHEGNSQASDEEVEKIKQLANELIGRTLYLDNGESREVTLDDMLFVAPYNHQVRKLQMALGDNAKVGSVDKFQGQEAPIVFLSMCASDANESPRGIEFLLNKNRLNVAISRAQTLAIVVGNPNLGKLSISNVEQMKLANLYNALILK